MSSQTSKETGTTRGEPVWKIVAGREISTKLREKAFVGSTLFMLVLIVGGFVVLGFTGGGSAPRYDVAVVDAAGSSAVAAGEQTLTATDDEARVSAVEESSADAAEQAVRDGDVDAALVPSDGGTTILGDSEIDGDLESALRAGVASSVTQANADAAGVDLADLTAGTTADVRLLDAEDDADAAGTVVAFAFALIFYVTALTFGLQIAQSVVLEKESRVVEILAAAIPIRTMLWGKIVGNTVLALGQILLFVAVGVVGAVATGRADVLAGVGSATIFYVVFFVLGFVALASLWSVAGSLANRQQDLQSTTLPGQVILFAPYILTFTAGASVKTVVSMLPIVSTMVMPGRMAEGDVPYWQVAVAIATTVAAGYLFLRVGTRMYERSLLQTGRKMGYREALTGDR